MPRVPTAFVQGVSEDYVLNGDDFPLFANAAIVTEFEGPVQVTLTIALANPAAGALVDANAASDGSSNVGGIYAISGTSDVVTKAWESLVFAASGGNTTFALSVSGGVNANDAGNISEPANLDDSYSGGGVSLWSNAYASHPITLTNSTYLDDDYVNSPSQSYAQLTLDAASAVISTPTVLTLVNETANQNIVFNDVSAGSASGDNGQFSLHNSNLAISGANENVSAYASAVSFTGAGAATTLDNGHGFDDVIVEFGVSLTFEGDQDVFYFDSAGDALTLSGAQSAWSTLYANAYGGVVNLDDAMLAIYGGGVTVNRLAVAVGNADDDALSLSQTNGVADIVNGDDLTVGLNASLAVIAGRAETIGATAGATAGLTGTSDQWDGFYGSSDVIGLSGAQAAISGGADTIGAGSGSAMSLINTAGQADVVYASDDLIYLNAAQASISGGGNTIYATAGSLLVMQGAAGHADVATASNDTVALTNALAGVVGDDDVIGFSGENTLGVQGVSETFYFAASMGLTSMAGFATSDVLHLSAADWSSFAALQASGDLQQSGANTLIAFDAVDMITLINVNASTLTAAQFAFA